MYITYITEPSVSECFIFIPGSYPLPCSSVCSCECSDYNTLNWLVKENEPDVANRETELLTMYDKVIIAD